MIKQSSVNDKIDYRLKNESESVQEYVDRFSKYQLVSKVQTLSLFVGVASGIPYPVYMSDTIITTHVMCTRASCILFI